MLFVCLFLFAHVTLAVDKTPPVFDPNCKDAMDACDAFPDTSCVAPYEDWAKKNCMERCGYCVGPSTPPPACLDVLDNCDTYGKELCTKPEYKPWIEENCRAFCREQFCTPEQVRAYTTTTTTIAPEKCYDHIDCRNYDHTSCVGEFSGWAKDNCPLTCGMCKGTPTTPPPCVDHIPTCKTYDPGMCTNPDYKTWVEDNCRKFCGLC